MEEPHTDTSEYITVEEVSVILGVTPRQAARYQDKARTKKLGHRVLYHRGDIEEQARLKGREQEINDAAKEYQQRKPPKVELMPTNDVLDYLRQRDQERDALIERQQQQLLQAAHTIGELQERLRRYEEEQKQLPDSHQKSWWRRLLA